MMTGIHCYVMTGIHCYVMTGIHFYHTSISSLKISHVADKL
jgi:hypothetical protein